MAFLDSLKDFFVGSPATTRQLQLYTPEQQNTLNALLNQAQTGLQPQNFGSNFAPIAKQAEQRFQQQTVPTLAERFTSLGGGLSSPAFASQLGQAGAGMQTDLAALQSQFGLQQQGNLMNLLSLGLMPQFEAAYVPRKPGVLELLAGQGAQAAQQVLPLLFGGLGGGAGVAAGAGLGLLNSLGSASSGTPNIAASSPSLASTLPQSIPGAQAIPNRDQAIRLGSLLSALSGAQNQQQQYQQSQQQIQQALNTPLPGSLQRPSSVGQKLQAALLAGGR